MHKHKQKCTFSKKNPQSSIPTIKNGNPQPLFILFLSFRIRNRQNEISRILTLTVGVENVRMLTTRPRQRRPPTLQPYYQTQVVHLKQT